MPKGGLSYRSLSECLKGARAKGLPESACDVLKKPGNDGGVMPPPDNSGTRQPDKKKDTIYPQPDPKKKRKGSAY
tara:strand:+ start:372 stop:596 length:225 start_codon:yes stop_codon:yes gene_type:complete